MFARTTHSLGVHTYYSLIFVGISMPVEANSRIVSEVSSMPSDGTSRNYGLPSVRSNTIQKPTYAKIVRKVRSTARRRTGQTIS